VAIIAVSLVAGACTSSPSPTPVTTTTAPSPSTSTSPFSTGSTTPEISPSTPVDEDTARAIDVLTRTGVQIYQDDAQTQYPGPSGPPSPLHLLQYQVANLTHGGGIAATDLDGLVPMPEGDPPFSSLVAGYVAKAKTPGAGFSRGLMRGQELRRPATLVFPKLTLALFLADVLPRGTSASASASAARSGGGPADGPPGGGSDALMPFSSYSALQLNQAGFCADLKSFLTGTINAILSVVSEITNHIPIIGTIVSWAGALLGLGADAISQLLNTVPFIKALKKAIAIVGILVMSVSALQPWHVDVMANPAFLHYRVEGNPDVTGLFRATVATGSDPLAVVRPCADLAGINLPPAETAVGAGVKWVPIQGVGEHAFETAHDDAVKEGNIADWRFRMQSEPASVHKHGSEETAVLQVRAVVHRGTVDVVSKLANELFGSNVLSTFVGKILGPALINQANQAVTKILKLSDAGGIGTALVSFHAVQVARFEAHFDDKYFDRSITGESCNGLEGPWTVTFDATGKGILTGSHGSGDGSFTLPGGEGPGHLHMKFPVHVEAGGVSGNGAHVYDLTVTLLEADQPALRFEGTFTAITPAGPFPGHGQFKAQVTFGGTCSH